ncbi:ferredoxin--NADP reductase [Burkholderia vietnamiensis]|uniref:ferredoxin--NADP reductase n=1 Tax=Burkholderia vietnamiensis TaxID=60552 RepID=UPI0015932BC8|nr:ferredoxin--NADP reductase [Burkholderia vietnamiensis]
MAIQAHSLRITDVAAQGKDAILLTLEVDEPLQQAFRFQSGQYLTLGVTVEGDEHWRCYSITSEPISGQPISVLVRRVAGGRVSNWLCDQARVGEYIRVLPPAGHFTLARPGSPVLLYAGGSGIAPIYALAREALAQGSPRVRMFYANRDRDTAMLLSELQALEQQADGRLEIQHWYDAEQGLPSTALLSAQAEGQAQADVYLCGPEPFMRAVQASVQTAGIAAQQVHLEDFGATMEADAGPTSGAGDAPDALLTVQMKGVDHAVPVRDGEMLLAAMLRAGLPAPHACRVGECASCMCRLQEGEVQRLENSVLDDDDVADGWLLACRARAASPSLRIKF